MPETIREIIISAYDRLEEAHWNIHQIELNYHESDSFRYSLNSFLRVIKEVSQILQMELQNKPGFIQWYRKRRQITYEDPLIADLFKKRDIMVHRLMLSPKSSAYLGITEGRGLKAGLGMELNPFQDSDYLMVNFLLINSKSDEDLDVFGILSDDDDQLPCIERYWGLDPFEEGILELAVQAWKQIAALTKDTITWLGEDPTQLRLSIDCIHSSSSVALLTYKREWIEILNKAIDNGKDFYQLMHIIKALRTGY
ncbi:MAG: hypothetical protein ACI35O_04380 [Bacillaceae bacterium]